MSWRFGWGLIVLVSSCAALSAQIIEFESGGLRSQTKSRNCITIMYAHLPAQVREYTIVQATVSNGSSGVQTIRPEDFAFRFPARSLSLQDSGPWKASEHPVFVNGVGKVSEVHVGDR
jgi:hypothetical protein